MSDYEKQFQPAAKSYDSKMRKVEKNGGETAVSGRDRHVYDWAVVLRDLEAYY
jgi:hypothetical protein